MANFKGSLETLSLYLSRYNFFGSASFVCVKSGKFLQPNLLSNNSTFGLQSFLPYYAENSWKKLLPSGSNIIQCCCCCGKNPTLFLSSDNKKYVKWHHSNSWKREAKGSRWMRQHVIFFFGAKNPVFVWPTIFFCVVAIWGMVWFLLLSPPPQGQNLPLLLKKRGPSSSSLGGKRST